MGRIRYTAKNRGELVGGHTAGTQYVIETAWQGYPRTPEVKGSFDEALDGTPEGWLHAYTHTWQMTSDLVLLADRPSWREFWSSVAARELFEIDFTGTVAAPGTYVPVWCLKVPPEPQIGGIGAQYSFVVKRYPA